MPKVRKKTTTISSPKKKESPKEEVYCRKCMQTKLPTDFYQSVDKYLDSNGLMSVCRDCMQEMFDRAMMVDRTLDKAVLSLCRTLNVKYDERAIESIRTSMDNADKDGKKFDFTFGKYLNLLPRFSPRGEGAKFESRSVLDLTFKEPDTFVKGEPLPEDMETDLKDHFEDFWGEGFSQEDYQFLEKEFSKWTASTRCDTQSEVVILQEVCHKQNAIRKARLEDKPTKDLVKELQELMKNGALTPDKQNAASAGESYESFGRFIKMIEKKRPADIFDDLKKFKDIDGIIPYTDDYIVRPMKNFITQSRDFNVAELDKIDGDDSILEDV